MNRLPRALHPGAWWGWAIGMAVAVSTTTNPLLLLIGLAVTVLVVVSRRGGAPWARAFRLYLYLGAVIVLVRVVLHVLVGVKYGEVTVLPLPTVDLPSWAAGIQLLGTVRLEGVLAAALEGARLALMIVCVGAANALADAKRLLKALPSALHEVGAAVVVSVTVAPQLAESVQRVLRARRLRGDSARGIRALGRVAVPVLHDTLDRSLLLAAAMESRGYGHRVPLSSRARTLTATLTLGGLVGAAIGSYGLLDTTSPAVLGLPMLLVGVVLAAAGLRLGGRAVRRTVYRPDPWSTPEWLTVAAGIAAAAAALASVRLHPEAMTMPLSPLAPPPLPPLATIGLLLGALPAVLTPPPPAPARRPAARRRLEVA